ncbi:MFS transporter [Clostridium sp. AF19-22AC]|jgi:sugar (glycoside-pentoside-hexuronide) transporter|uniref:MFS transporter n=1 Tax=Clostridia TaxID=186801 RepID=UPI000E49D6C3|nr:MULTISPECIES: MFS transporter [Clostridia]RHR31899.1 MFS transporter [Clostridium sp. AF19-22AC]
MNQDKVTLKEKISYVAVNLGNIPITTLASSFLLIFYTNVCGMNPAACATLFLVARVLDGLNDPFVGFVIDHLPNTKYGHFRPPLIVGTILCSLNFLLLWFGPMMAPSGKLVIAYISYLLLGVLFPVMDISLNSMLPVMTTDMKERNALSSIKGTFYMLGVLAISTAAPLILGDTSNRAGYVRLILIVVVLVVVLSIGGALGLKERVKPKPGKGYKVTDLFKVITYKPIWATFLSSLLYMTGFTIINTVNTYYFTYILGNFTMFSVVSLVQTAAIFPAMLLTGKLIESIGKKKLYIIGLLTFGVLPVVRMLNVTSIPLLIVAALLIGAGQGICMPLMYGIQADNTDYVEVETGKRMEGAIASLSSFITKFAMGVGGAIPGYILAAAGFDASLQVQPDSVNTVIVLCLGLFPAVFSLIGILIFGFAYPLSKEKLIEQVNYLQMKRKEQNS